MRGVAGLGAARRTTVRVALCRGRRLGGGKAVEVELRAGVDGPVVFAWRELAGLVASAKLVAEGEEDEITVTLNGWVDDG